MADENKAKMEIEVNAVANEKSAEQTVKKLADGVEKASKKGHIEVPININTLIDKKDTESKLSKAQLDVVKSINKMSKKGFSASAKDIDVLNSKMTEFTHQLDQAGKGRQNKIFREIRKQVDELNKSYKALQVNTKSARVHDTKAKNTGSKNNKKTAEDRYLDKQEQYSRKAQGAGKRAELKKELDYVRENKSPIKSSGDIKASMTDEHRMKLSEYSAHGSNWANELAKILKEEVAKSTKTLVTYIDPIYTKNTKNGRSTDEKIFLTDTIKSVRKQLKNSIKELEAGSEEITLDSLKEQAAVIKVLTKALGKTTEDAEKTINSAIQSRYSEIENSEKRRKLGGVDREEGTEKGIGPGHENTQKLITQLYKAMEAWDSEVIADKIGKEIVLGTNRVKKSEKISQADRKIRETKSTTDYKAELNSLNTATNKTHEEIRNGTKATKESTKATNRNTTYDKIENLSERIADSKQQDIETVNRDINRDTAKAVKKDVDTGFNTDAKSEKLIDTIEKNNTIELPETTTGILQSILTQVTAILSVLQPEKIKRYKISKKDSKKETFNPIKNALIPLQNSGRVSTETPKAVSKSKFGKISTKLAEGEKESVKVEKSNIYASPIKQTIWDKLGDAIDRATGATNEYNKVMKATADEQDQLAAERIKTYGMNNGRNPNDTGDIAGMRRILELYRTNKASIDQNPELMQRIKLTKGVKVDTTEITKAFNKTLSGKQMRNAQMGGSPLRQILGGMTGFIGMPSIEKSRAQADGLNQILGNVNKALNSVLSSIQMKETELKGMQESGQVEFDEKGYIKKGSSASKKTLADLEEYKLVLNSILADMNTVDSIVKKTDGKFSKLVKRLSFTSPVLRENNDILRNINAGLDKGGKVLKFQTRMAEILNYTFQLMSRSIGQWLKRILSLLHPFNIVKNLANQIRNLLSDFGSYDVKWQRTMNVIKINFQRVIKPMMEWLAQKLVNIIGFFDIISQRIQAAFGKIPISLFDQAGAESEKIRRNLEEAANVSLGFDELHDIGTDQSGANDLTGEIYKPELSQDWIDMATKLGDTLGGFFNGDLGFGKVCGVILELLGKLLSTIGSKIWNWFKTTTIGKWIIDHLTGPFGEVLSSLGKLLKDIGDKIWNWFKSTAIGKYITEHWDELLGKILGKFGELLGSIASTIWGWFKQTAIGEYITEHWKEILATILGIFLTWKLLKIAGSILFNALFGSFTESAIGALTSKIGSWLSNQFVWGTIGGTSGKLFATTFAGKVLQGLAGLAAIAATLLTFTVSFKIGKSEGKQTAWGEQSDAKGFMDSVLKSGGVGVLGGVATGALAVAAGATTAALLPIVAAITAVSVAIGVATYEVTKANEQFKIQQGLLMNSEYYTSQLTDANTLLELQELRLKTQQIQYNTELEKAKNLFNELSPAVKDQYGGSLETLIEKTDYGTTLTGNLTSAEQALKDQLSIVKTELGDVNTANENLAKTKERILKLETLSAIAADVESEKYELAAARIELAMAQGVLTVDESSKLMQGAFDKASASERDSMLQNMDPELRSKFLGYLASTDKFKNDYIKYYQEANDEVKKLIDDPSVTKEMEKAGQENAEALRKGLQNASTWDKFKAWWAGVLPGGKTKDDVYVEIGSRGSTKTSSHAIGTNYVPSDGLTYIHRGEAIIPKDENIFAKQGKAWQGQFTANSQMLSAITRLEQIMAQGINVKGEFRQRGNDLVATVEKNKNRQSNNVLNNKVYAR